MHIEFLVEEYSAEAALSNLLPLILRKETTYAIRAFNGKPDLINKLRDRLKAYRKWMPNNWRIVVLVDQDREDCRELKAKLEHIAMGAGFVTKSSATGQDKVEVINRLAIEELESWFFGDSEALVKAYQRVSKTFNDKAQYRNPDAISGGTWEALERLLQKSGYYPGGMPKVETARSISKYMTPSENRSKSFQIFRDALDQLS